LVLNLIELDDIKGKDNDLQAYVKVKLGRERTKENCKTKTHKSDETGRDVKIEETFVIDVTDANDIKQDDEIELEFEVYDDNWSDTLLCCCALKMREYMEWRPYEAVDLWLDLNVAGDDDINGRIHVEMKWQPAVTGLVKITLNSATGLKDGGLMDKCDPYVTAELGPNNKCRR
jgi:hypothetical protein